MYSHRKAVPKASKKSKRPAPYLPQSKPRHPRWKISKTSFVLPGCRRNLCRSSANWAISSKSGAIPPNSACKVWWNKSQVPWPLAHWMYPRNLCRSALQAKRAWKATNTRDPPSSSSRVMLVGLIHPLRLRAQTPTKSPLPPCHHQLWEGTQSLIQMGQVPWLPANRRSNRCTLKPICRRFASINRK